MARKFLSLEGLEYFLNKIKALIPIKISQLQNDANFVTTDSINDIIATTQQSMLEKLYPIGKIEMNTSGQNPNQYLGFGTWVAWGAGRVPVGVDTSDSDFSTVEKTGGDKTCKLLTANLPAHTHTYTKATGTASIKLKADQCALPSHIHNQTKGFFTWVGEGKGDVAVTYQTGGPVDYVDLGLPTNDASIAESTSTHNHSIASQSASTGSVGSATPISIQQKYITCYMWKRIT